MNQREPFVPYHLISSSGRGTEEYDNADQRLQPVKLFVVTYRPAVTQCLLSMVTQLLFPAWIYVDAFTKLVGNVSEVHITEKLNPSCPYPPT